MSISLVHIEGLGPSYQCSIHPWGRLDIVFHTDGSEHEVFCLSCRSAMIVRPVFALIVHPEFPIPKLPVLDPPFFDVFDQPMAVDPDAYRLWELQYKLAYRAAINRRNVALAEQAVLTKALAWHDKRGLSAWLGGADPEELELHAAVKSLRRCLQ